MTDQTSWQASFLSKFSPSVQEKLLSLAEPFQFKAGQDIIRPGDSSLYLYIVKSGHVAVEMDVPTRGRSVMRTGGAGDIFGWSALVEPRLATAWVRAMEDTETIGIKGGGLMDECLQDYELGFEFYRALTEVIAGRLMATRRQYVNILLAG